MRSLVAAVGGDCHRAGAAGVAEPQVAIAIERLQPAVGRISGVELAAALGAGRAPAAATAAPPGRRPGRPISAADFKAMS